MTVVTPEPLALDLDAERDRRAAEREGKAQALPIVIGGETIATLPVELPLDVFSPLREIDDSITLVLRSVIDMWRGGEEAAERWDAAQMIVNVLAVNPDLPVKMVEVVTGMGQRLFGDEGFDRLIAARLTREDLGYLVGGIAKFYGLTPGESSPSSDSSTGDGGPTSSTTSTPTSDSTPEGSGETPAIPASSDSDASSDS